MVRHKIHIKRKRWGLGGRCIASSIRRCITAALTSSGVDRPCAVDVLVTDKKEIHSINLAQRNIDRPTDVLSFPSFSLTPLTFSASADMQDPETGRIFLGDIVISADAVSEQAQSYNHSSKRELSYLTVHAALHLLGFDHQHEADKRLMRQKEEEILATLDIKR